MKKKINKFLCKYFGCPTSRKNEADYVTGGAFYCLREKVWDYPRHKSGRWQKGLKEAI